MISKTINELIADLSTPTALRAVDTLTELAKFDETVASKDEIRHMLNLLDQLFEDDDVYFSLIGGRLRNHAMNEVCRVSHILENLLDPVDPLNDIILRVSRTTCSHEQVVRTILPHSTTQERTMSSIQPIMIVITPETVLDVYLEYGMPQGMYDSLSAAMDVPDKESLAQLTIIGLNELNGKVSLEEALYRIMLTLVELSNTNLGND